MPATLLRTLRSAWLKLHCPLVLMSMSPALSAEVVLGMIEVPALGRVDNRAEAAALDMTLLSLAAGAIGVGCFVPLDLVFEL